MCIVEHDFRVAMNTHIGCHSSLSSYRSHGAESVRTASFCKRLRGRQHMAQTELVVPCYLVDVPEACSTLDPWTASELIFWVSRSRSTRCWHEPRRIEDSHICRLKHALCKCSWSRQEGFGWRTLCRRRHLLQRGGRRCRRSSLDSRSYSYW